MKKEKETTSKVGGQRWVPSTWGNLQRTEAKERWKRQKVTQNRTTPMKRVGSALTLIKKNERGREIKK